MSMAQIHLKPNDRVYFPFDSKGSIPIRQKPVMVARHEMKTIEYMWRLFNNLPRNQPRLVKTYDATMRLIERGHSSILPPRSEYTNTVDYYEAALPLMRARAHFRKSFIPDMGFATIIRACATLLPDQLF